MKISGFLSASTISKINWVCSDTECVSFKRVPKQANKQTNKKGVSKQQSEGFDTPYVPL